MLLKTMIKKIRKEIRKMKIPVTNMYALIRSVSPRIDTWIVDSGASKHMIGYKDSLSCLVQKESPHQ